jgi:hypothetical protein
METFANQQTKHGTLGSNRKSFKANDLHFKQIMLVRFQHFQPDRKSKDFVTNGRKWSKALPQGIEPHETRKVDCVVVRVIVTA